jgi:hypothetical protein
VSKFVPRLLFLIAVSTASALDIDGYDPALHDRFSSGYPTAPVPNTSASFIGAAYDWSGVGWNSANPEQSFAMISDRYFVYAEHFAPGPTISFLTSSHTVFTANVSSTLFQATSSTLGLPGDLAVGMLSEPLDASLGIASYPIFSLPSFSAYTGLEMLVYGHGATNGSSPRIGTNIIDGIVPFDLFGTTAPDAEMIGFSDSGTPIGEAFLIAGDSGSPSFVAINGQLALVGTHTATDFVGGIPTSFDSFVPDYLASLDAHGVSYRVVPEPSSAILLTLGFGAWMARRRR